jgi:polyvinyl alcohol dehydrogenase (cytochrome)
MAQARQSRDREGVGLSYTEPEGNESAMIRRLCAAILFLAATTLFSQTKPSGEAVYKTRCAGCHEQSNPRIPAPDALRKMAASRILRTLNYGAMIAIAYTMSLDEREAVANYLGIAGPETQPPASAFCKDRAVKIAANPTFQWNGWSPDANNLRFQNTQSAGLSIDQVKRLKLKWAFAFDGDITAFSQPTILDNNLFTGSAGGAIYALAADSGCIRWTYQAVGPVRTSILHARDGNRNVMMFGDQIGWFYALDAASGKELWKKRVEKHDAARLTGTPIADRGIVYVPVAGWEENRASDPKYECCTMRGSVAALRIRDGSIVWQTFMVDPPKETGVSKNNTKTWGPSGAGIWSAPTLDRDRGLLYVTTGDNYSKPTNELSDAVVALDLKTGKIKWFRQFTEGDAFSGACVGTPDCGPDFDFGSSVMLVEQGAKQVVIAGQKSGVVYGLDPDKNGEILWQLRVGKGGTNGGVQWGMASDGQFVYAAVSDVVRAARKKTDLSDLRERDLDPEKGGGLTAIRLSDGKQAWYAPSPACNPPKPGCSPAQPAAVTAIPGAVFAGSYDGHMRAYSSEDGKLLWDFDTAREFTTVNGARGNGGSIDGPGAVVVNGMVYVNSGYSRQGGMPGNVLLAFSAE